MSVVGTDFDDVRLETLRKKAEPLAKANGASLRLVNTQTDAAQRKVQLLRLDGADRCAGAPARFRTPTTVRSSTSSPAFPLRRSTRSTSTPTSTNAASCSAPAARRSKTCGSCCARWSSEGFDTNASVDAVSGMAGAIDGIASVENRTLAGKIIVYPMLHDVGLIPLSELGAHFPTVAAKLDGGKWTRAAEQELLRVAAI